MAPPPTDSDLRAALSRMAEGDPAGLRAFAAAAGPWLLGALHQSCEDPAEAAGILRDVLLEVWRAARLYDDHFGPPLAWALSLARERALGASSRRTGGAELAPLTDPEPGRAAALAALPADDRSALLAAWRGDRLDLPGGVARREPAARALRALVSGSAPP